jgi:hypothetical protein
VSLLLALLAATAPTPDAWLDGLYARAAADARAGRAVVVQVHVALCDNTIIRCGGHGLGDGDSLATNLYWATSGGLRGWFERRGSGWARVARRAAPRDGVLEEIVYHRRVEPSAAWRAHGVTAPFDAYVVATAWRGRRIDDALDTFLADLYGTRARTIALDGDGATLAAGGAAHVVAYVGHDRFMDRERVDFRALERRAGSAPRAPKGMIMIACASGAYLARESSPARVPLVLTTDLLFAGSHALDGAVRALLDGGSFADVRAGTARAYADGQDKPLARVRTLFTNPSDPRWR